MMDDAPFAMQDDDDDDASEQREEDFARLFCLSLVTPFVDAPTLLRLAMVSKALALTLKSSINSIVFPRHPETVMLAGLAAKAFPRITAIKFCYDSCADMAQALASFASFQLMTLELVRLGRFGDDFGGYLLAESLVRPLQRGLQTLSLINVGPLSPAACLLLHGCELKSLTITQSPTLTDFMVETIVKDCPALVSVTLSEIPSLISPRFGHLVGLKRCAMIGCVSLQSIGLPEAHALEVLDVSWSFSLPVLPVFNSFTLCSLTVSYNRSIEHIALDCPNLRALTIQACALLKTVEVTRAFALQSLVIATCLGLTSVVLGDVLVLEALDLSFLEGVESISIHTAPALQRLLLDKTPALRHLSLRGATPVLDRHAQCTVTLA